MSFHWLKTDHSLPPAPQSNGAPNKKGYLEKTLREITSFFVNGIFSEETTAKAGFLQALDPRAKVFTLGIFVIAVTLYKNIYILLGAYAFTILLAHLSKIGIGFFLIRVWLFIPLFSGIIALPAVLNIFVPGDPLVDLVTLEKEIMLGPLKIPQTVSVTKQGLLSASVFVMRVATSVSLVVLLTLTTKWPHILKSLSVFRVPQFFTFILGMTYRYIHLLLRLIEDVHLARRSRTIGKEKASSGRKWIISQIRFVMKKSLSTGEQVYSAMVSRGFMYELKTADNFKIKPIDYAWSAFAVTVTAVTLVLNWI
ncbi:MAG: cobalt ECF transporter T component CbiQ [Nitrospirae bacterium]|nr:cobalt ECF transporter T component CbiQ [Nitrospirota bacterium]